jgi:hypothetical protein
VAAAVDLLRVRPPGRLAAAPLVTGEVPPERSTVACRDKARAA